jgi:dolichyl-phosphate-mannose-protein mannosyltransferase
MNNSKVFIFIIILASLLTHFLFFGHPNETVFDEVHFGKFISGYFTHEYFFDIHPPLGKLLISGMGYLAGFRPGFSFAEIGQKFPDNIYLWLRLLPTLAGVLLPLVIFFLVLRLRLSRIAAFSAAMLVVFENAILVQSRFILLDSFLLLFGFSALLAYFKYAQENKTPYLFLSGALAALSLSVKWTGATFLIIIIILEAIRCRFYLRSHLKATLVKIILPLIVLPFIAYFSIFAIHLGLLTKSGPGDAFMSLGFQKTLAGSTVNAEGYKPLGLMAKFVELNLKMYGANANLTAGHPYSSKWYAWPFMARPIYYWYENSPSAAGKESRIYFSGNPVIWWASTVAIVYSLFILARDTARRKPKNKTLALLGGAYLFNLLPFIGITRAMFLYHYMIGLIFAIIALAYLIDRGQSKNKIFVVLLAVSFLAFLFFSPLTYGLPLTNSAYHLRVWFPGWQ